jgi:hypothetical protein
MCFKEILLFKNDHCGNLCVPHKMTVVMDSWILPLHTRLLVSELQSINSKAKDHLRRLRHRWEHNIKTYLKEINFEDIKWTDLDQDKAH